MLLGHAMRGRQELARTDGTVCYLPDIERADDLVLRGLVGLVA
jgi:hypothetical protein